MAYDWSKTTRPHLEQTGPVYPSGADEFTPSFSGVHAAQSLVFLYGTWQTIVCLFDPVLLAIVVSVPRFTVSNYLSIFKLFLCFVIPRNKFLVRAICVGLYCVHSKCQLLYKSA